MVTEYRMAQRPHKSLLSLVPIARQTTHNVAVANWRLVSVLLIGVFLSLTNVCLVVLFRGVRQQAQGFVAYAQPTQG